MEQTRIQALRSGVILIDGRPCTLKYLDAKLREIRATDGIVLYYREQPRLAATPEQLMVFEAVMAADVAIEFHSTGDFSQPGSAMKNGAPE